MNLGPLVRFWKLSGLNPSPQKPSCPFLRPLSYLKSTILRGFVLQLDDVGMNSMLPSVPPQTSCTSKGFFDVYIQFTGEMARCGLGVELPFLSEAVQCGSTGLKFEAIQVDEDNTSRIQRSRSKTRGSQYCLGNSISIRH